MNGRDERKVSAKRLDTAKRNMDTIQKAFAAPQLQSWTGLDAASWFLDNILLASNHSTNDKVLKSMTSYTKTIVSVQKLADIRSGPRQFKRPVIEGQQRRVRCNHCDKLGHIAANCFATCGASSCQKSQCRNKYRSQRDYSKKEDYKRDDYKRDDRDRDRDFLRRENTRFNPRVRIRSPPMERSMNDK
ncbi:hypothetical protein BDR26DRAFT_958088 [Obelidium mucronatum]|nr:hypothetical protein BDR26DRAFT_958088 [Obelidium mucronatum]